MLSLDEVIKNPYSKVTIELTEDFEIKELKEILSDRGETKINLIIKSENKKSSLSFQNNRKFDLNHLKF